MEPRAASYTKLVPSLDDKVLSVIEVVRSFLAAFVVGMCRLGALGFGLGAF